MYTVEPPDRGNWHRHLCGYCRFKQWMVNDDRVCWLFAVKNTIMDGRCPARVLERDEHGNAVRLPECLAQEETQ